MLARRGFVLAHMLVQVAREAVGPGHCSAGSHLLALLPRAPCSQLFFRALLLCRIRLPLPLDAAAYYHLAFMVRDLNIHATQLDDDRIEVMFALPLWRSSWRSCPATWLPSPSRWFVLLAFSATRSGLEPSEPASLLFPSSAPRMLTATNPWLVLRLTRFEALRLSALCATICATQLPQVRCDLIR